VNLMLDTQIILWLSVAPERIPRHTSMLLQERDNRMFFSPASLIEVAIKRGTPRGTYLADPDSLRRTWLENGVSELAVTGAHAAVMDRLPRLHKDPFDRLLLSQAIAENMTLLTADDILTRYPSNVMDAR
jgi:PIN domain nuclease of toxin-antitoxin system